MRLDAAAAAGALDALAGALGVRRLVAAEGVVRVVNAAMARALRVISVERGRDPREFTLVAFGGAAGLHACELADDLGMRTVLIPRDPGLLSAAGMAAAPIARDYVLSVRQVAPPLATLERVLAPVYARGRAELAAQGVTRAALVASRFARLRYLGQSHEIEVPLGVDYRRRFDAAHARLYGHAAPERQVEVLALRLTLSDAGRHVVRRRPIPVARSAKAAASQSLRWRGRAIVVARYVRDTLAPGARFRGPALVLEYSSTVLVPPGWRALVDADRNLRLAR
jgi:N-methylhydantoinase A